MGTNSVLVCQPFAKVFLLIKPLTSIRTRFFILIFDLFLAVFVSGAKQSNVKMSDMELSGTGEDGDGSEDYNVGEVVVFQDNGQHSISIQTSHFHRQGKFSL